MSTGEERSATANETEVWESLRAWRATHPRATMREIEDAVEEEIHRFRGKLVEQLTASSKTQDLKQSPEDERPRCDARSISAGL
jgi:hypothetical protein